jgi:hypothetical protein
MQRRLSALAMVATGTIQSLLSSLRRLLAAETLTYRPEKYYMRGPRRK